MGWGLTSDAAGTLNSSAALGGPTENRTFMAQVPSRALPIPPWIVTATLDTAITLPDAGVVGRDDFHAWLWEHAAGLLGIDEGAVTAADAAARSLVPSALVLDAAAAPADRDWVAALALAEVAWWFHDEAAARAAVRLVAPLTGCRVRGIRADAAVDHEAVARASFQAIAVPGFGVVKPAWDRGAAGVTADGTAEIFIEPGLGFGTGLHETTQLCLAAVADRHRRGAPLDRVLDFGGGSGILGIAAAVLGAGRVDVVEIDTAVHAVIQANAGRNDVEIRLTTHLPADAGGYDIVVANIVAAVLLEHAAALAACVSRHDGELILSGLLAEQLPAVSDRFTGLLGVRPVIQARGDWRCLHFRRE